MTFCGKENRDYAVCHTIHSISLFPKCIKWVSKGVYVAVHDLWKVNTAVPVSHPSNNSVIPGFHHTLYDWEPLCWGCSEGGERKQQGVAVYMKWSPFHRELAGLSVTHVGCGTVYFIYLFIRSIPKSIYTSLSNWYRNSQQLNCMALCLSGLLILLQL